MSGEIDSRAEDLKDQIEIDFFLRTSIVLDIRYLQLLKPKNDGEKKNMVFSFTVVIFPIVITIKRRRIPFRADTRLVISL